jgi:methyltransferase (TIGR00027 family)
LPFDDALLEAGFSPNVPSAWLIEGLLPYLSEASVRQMFERISTLAIAKSTLCLDTAGTKFRTEPEWRELLEALHDRGIEFDFACDDPQAFLATFGWRAECMSLSELSRRYGRPVVRLTLDSSLVRATR